jgi:rhamnosyltransferase
VNHDLSSVAGTVVLFNPGKDIHEAIETYVNQVSRLFVIDNSTDRDLKIVQRLQQIEKVVYINNNGNKGIANALNAGCAEAIKQGYKYLLTMDQDTRLSAKFVSSLMKGLSEWNSDTVGIIAPRYTVDHRQQRERLQEVKLTMTSGNILNLAAYEKVGPFLDELFIDHVDHEYCFRLRQNGYAIIQLNDVEILHRPGNLTTIKFFGKEISFSSHTPLRLYYYARNGFYVGRKYRESFPEFRRLFRNLLMKEIFKIPFESDKILRLKMIIKGYKDYKSDKLGAIGAAVKR